MIYRGYPGLRNISHLEMYFIWRFIFILSKCILLEQGAFKVLSNTPQSILYSNSQPGHDTSTNFREYRQSRGWEQLTWQCISFSRFCGRKIITNVVMISAKYKKNVKKYSNIPVTFKVILRNLEISKIKFKTKKKHKFAEEVYFVSVYRTICSTRHIKIAWPC